MTVPNTFSLKQLHLLPSDAFYVTVNGRIVDWETLDEDSIFSVHFRLRGGKGGFGSLLRSFRIHRSTNQLMCRDLSGRRLADVKEEERLRKWIEKAAEREEQKQRKRREKYEKLKTGPPKHEFDDPDYIKLREKLLDEADDAFEAGMAVVCQKKDKPTVSEEPSSSSEEDNPLLPGPSKRGVKRKRKYKIFERKQFRLDEDSATVKKDVREGANLQVLCDKVEVQNEAQNDPDVEASELKSVVSLGKDNNNLVLARSLKLEPEMKDLASSHKEKENDTHLPANEEVEQSNPKPVSSDINLENFDDVTALQKLGLEQLKTALEIRGLKCGGTLEERAARLFAVKGLRPEEYPKSLKAFQKKKLAMRMNKGFGRPRNGPQLQEKRKRMKRKVARSSDADNGEAGKLKDEVNANSREVEDEEHAAEDAEEPTVRAESSSEAENDENFDVTVNRQEGSGSSLKTDSILMSIRNQADKAIDVLLRVADRKKGKLLFPEVDQAVLPHPYYDSTNATVCLIMADLDTSGGAKRDPDVDKQARQWEEKLLEEHGVTKKDVQKILTLTQLTREYFTYTDKRQLATAYDIFLADSCVADIVKRNFGKEFHKRRKLPISINLAKGNVLKQIKKSYSYIYLPVSANRTRTSLQIGHLGQKKSDLLDNVQEVVARLFEYCPGGQDNVRSLSISMSSQAPSIPIFIDFGSANEVDLPKPKRDRKDKDVIEEDSTVPDGFTVKMRPDGKFRVVDNETGKRVFYNRRLEEWKPRDKQRLAEIKEMKAKKRQDILKRRKNRGDVKLLNLKKAFAKVVKKPFDKKKNLSLIGRAKKKSEGSKEVKKLDENVDNLDESKVSIHVKKEATLEKQLQMEKSTKLRNIKAKKLKMLKARSQDDQGRGNDTHASVPLLEKIVDSKSHSKGSLVVEGEISSSLVQSKKRKKVTDVLKTTNDSELVLKESSFIASPKKKFKSINSGTKVKRMRF